MGTVTSQGTSLTIVYTTVYSDADQWKHQSSPSLAFVWGEFPAQMASNAENVSIWWRHHDKGNHEIQLPQDSDNNSPLTSVITYTTWTQ